MRQTFERNGFLVFCSIEIAVFNVIFVINIFSGFQTQLHQMGRKYIPITVSLFSSKVYMADVRKIYKFKKKMIPELPTYK